jgi:hypothetical protein
MKQVLLTLLMLAGVQAHAGCPRAVDRAIYEYNTDLGAMVGAHVAQAMRELGYTQDQIEEIAYKMRNDGTPLPTAKLMRDSKVLQLYLHCK